ncbi:methyltransferase domain-containing protein [Streptosporangiaceae bacterium NEAU-GS5]|nr:methyltransferase domain-containing protein [Streptosporangiaceae bacterium NEAU-GS5]
MTKNRGWIWAGFGAAAMAAVAAAIWRRRSTPAPYASRFWIQIPRPLVTRRLLLSTLDPQPGERILEVGPGTGQYSLPVSRQLGPAGTLDILDTRRQTLDRATSRARRAGVGTISPAVGDVRTLPYSDETFDAAYLVTILGDIPDRAPALRELHRVIRPGGRVVFGETMADPDWVSPQALRREAAAAGFHFESHTPAPLGYFLAFTRS